MKAIDYRNTNFEGLRGQLDGMRQAVYEAWVKHGPGTTRQVAQLAGIDILTFRPRTTELYDVGLVGLLDAAAPGREGIYHAVPAEQWDIWQHFQISNQMQLI
jgi:hypothetical protein